MIGEAHLEMFGVHPFAFQATEGRQISGEGGVFWILVWKTFAVKSGAMIAEFVLNRETI